MKIYLRIYLRISFAFFLSFIMINTYAQNQTAHDFTAQAEVKSFIKQMVKKHHFQSKELYRLFSTVPIRPKIIQSIRTPLEHKPWYTYRLLYVTDERIKQGVLFWNRYEKSLKKAEQKFGVPAAIIVATIGVESRYGKNTGEYRVIDALVNLSFEDKRRANYFRKELEDFLLLTREMKMNPLHVMGSYAGAIGQPQFMPSSFRNYAINFSGTNKPIDLSHNAEDVIGSIANYYYKNGWIPHEPVTKPLNLGTGRYLFSLTRSKQITLFQLLENNTISDEFYKNNNGNLIELRGNYGNEYWIGFRNFEVIKRYNHSILYAMAVYQLSYFITALREEKNA